MSADNLVGRTVAGYHLAKYIGEGGTATVYRAEHPERGRAGGQDPAAATRAGSRSRSSASCARRSSAPGSPIPTSSRPTTTAQSDGLHYLALEWAEGEPLAEFVNRSGKLAPPLVATIVEQLGGALGAAHRAGIIHRDLKPANIMYDPADADGQAARLRDRAGLGAQSGGAADPGGVLRRDPPVRGPGNPERRAG